eukprot:613448-Hanusia_phi.AAC.1
MLVTLMVTSSDVGRHVEREVATSWLDTDPHRSWLNLRGGSSGERGIERHEVGDRKPPSITSEEPFSRRLANIDSGQVVTAGEEEREAELCTVCGRSISSVAYEAGDEKTKLATAIAEAYSNMMTNRANMDEEEAEELWELNEILEWDDEIEEAMKGAEEDKLLCFQCKHVQHTGQSRSSGEALLAGGQGASRAGNLEVIDAGEFFQAPVKRVKPKAACRCSRSSRANPLPPPPPDRARQNPRVQQEGNVRGSPDKKGVGVDRRARRRLTRVSRRLPVPPLGTYNLSLSFLCVDPLFSRSSHPCPSSSSADCSSRRAAIAELRTGKPEAKLSSAPSTSGYGPSWRRADTSRHRKEVQ